MRLQKYLADSGIASRRKCEELIQNGLVTVNGVTASLGCSVEEGDIVEYNGKTVAPARQKLVYAFYKPKNVICTSDDKEDRVKAIDFFKDVPHRLYTVGRLDFDSEGLIFVTNDGEFAELLTHPRYEKQKTYRVLCGGRVTGEELALLRAGVMLDDGMTAPAQARIIRKYPEKTELLLTIHEGRNRQVRRMMAAVGHSTLRLCRTAVGPITLDGLKQGERRLLTENEIASLTSEQ